MVYFTQLSRDFNNLDLRAKLGYALYKIREILKIKQNAFDLLLIKHRYPVYFNIMQRSWALFSY